jgi:hypothetical protein
MRSHDAHGRLTLWAIELVYDVLPAPLSVNVLTGDLVA